MRHVELNALFVSHTVEEVFVAILQWELPNPRAESSWGWMPDESDAVRPVMSGVRPRWLEFRTGMLKWNEEIHAFPEDSEIRFALVDGDFAEFTGKWVLRDAGADVAVRFEVDFDFGIPSMAGILDPIAETEIKAIIGRALSGMLSRVRFTDNGDAAALCFEAGRNR